MHQESLDIMWHYVNLIAVDPWTEPTKVLDVGSRQVGENRTYKEMFPSPRYVYTGLDVEPGNNVDVIPDDPYEWGLRFMGKFDLVISGQAFEHIEYPWLTIKQIEKVLVPGGYAILIAPTTPTIHRFPVDCWRILPDGWNALAKWADLKIIDSSMNQYHGDWHDSFCLLQKHD